MLLIKPIRLVFLGLASLVALTALALLMIVVAGDWVERSQCRPFKTISNDTVLNEKLRSELTDFINDAEHLRNLDGTTHFGFVTLNEYSFDGAPFPWVGLFDKYPAHQPYLELALRFDDKMRDLSPPYRISEVGIYGARSLLMYKNENEAQYTGGEGSVRLSKQPYVKCQVSFSRGVPVEE